MEDDCNNEFRNELGEFGSDTQEVEWFNCINDANEWKEEHLPN